MLEEKFLATDGLEDHNERNDIRRFLRESTCSCYTGEMEGTRRITCYKYSSP